MLLGGGRQSKEDIIDMSAGIVLKVKAKETIKKQDPLAVLYTDKPLTKEIETLVKSAFVFEK
ncbi:pyrimidine-nucleoside phosphorylase [Firmicutes bacterium CAG:631]|nr:pyrimidine-nucleoside phosphorylase [Firmicutes bacterium CAG:631]